MLDLFKQNLLRIYLNRMVHVFNQQNYMKKGMYFKFVSLDIVEIANIH